MPDTVWAVDETIGGAHFPQGSTSLIFADSARGGNASAKSSEKRRGSASPLRRAARSGTLLWELTLGVGKDEIAMRTNPVKRALSEGKPTFGTWLSLGDLFATRILARMNFAWLTLDMEHCAIDWSQAAMIFAAIADAGAVPLARVPKGNHDYIKRTLDAGAWGIVVPMVDTVEQAQIAIRAAKYPPLGNRSLGGGMHSRNFDTDSGEYFKRANDEILVVLQTESPTGVASAEAIYSLPGVDAIFVGPVDLRAQMRKADGTEASDAEFEAMIQRVIAAGKKTGTPTGMHVMDPKTALRRAEEGMQFIAIGSELRMMTEKASETLKAVGLGDRKELVKY
jgi:4-hydroxy-2-oxoheptanedioate aldolase